MEQQVISQVVAAWIVTQLVQMLKKWRDIPWMTARTDSINRVVGAVMAFFASVGIAFSFDAEAGTLLITGLTWGTVVTIFWTWVQQVVLQQIVYRGAVKETPIEAKATAKALEAGGGKVNG